MRAVNIANDKKRDAKVGFEPRAKPQAVRMALPDGREKRNVQFVKTSAGIDALLKKYGGLEALGEALVTGDPEINIETTGRFITKTHKLYLTSNGEIAYRLNMVRITRNPDGTEKERSELSKHTANIAADIPLRWTGREIPKNEAIRNYIFTRNYQLRHTSGLTYDFLYDMAKQLHTNNTMMFVGAGKKGNEPIVLSLGGPPYRGFLEGRIEGEKYALILHLSNMELRGL